MAAPLDTSLCLAALERLTGDKGDSCRHGQMFRMEVVSADGARCGVPIQVDSHPAQTRPYVLNAIADALLIRRDEIRRVLDEGTAGMLRRHLCRYTQAQLRPFQARTDHPERHSFFDVGPEDIPTPTTQRKD